MNRKVAFLVSIALGIISIDGMAETYYVAPDGSDKDPGSLSDPWRTIARANQMLRPGDTVLIRSGNYDGQSIEPSRSGVSESQRITYKAFPGDTPVIRRVKTGVILSGKQYITIDGVDMNGEVYRGRLASGWPGVGSGSSNIHHFAQISKSHYNVVRNVTWKYAHGWYGIVIDGGSHHNKILDSNFDFVGTYDNGLGDDKGDTLQIVNGKYNLVQGCIFRHGGHSSLVIEQGQFNVVRNNHFDGDYSDIEGPGRGARTVELKGEGPTNRTGGFNLFENNVLVNTKRPTDTLSAPAVKVNGIGQIVRRNIIFNNYGHAIITANGPGGSNGHVGRNHIYNNVFYNNGLAAWALFFHDSNGVTNDNNVFVNNIMYANRNNAKSNSDNAEIVYSNRGLLGRGNLISNNIMLKSSAGDAKVFTVEGKSNSLSWYESQHPNEFLKNIQLDPGFASASPIVVSDFKLSPSSPAIDTGIHLTKTTSSGSGTSIPVEDANFFSDGFGVSAGDKVIVGNNGLVIVQNVDYENNIIIVDRNVSWSRGDPVSLNYSGEAPDVGAFEEGIFVGITPPDPTSVRPVPPQDLHALSN